MTVFAHVSNAAAGGAGGRRPPALAPPLGGDDVVPPGFIPPGGFPGVPSMGGGMHMGPNDPMFAGRMRQQPGRGGLGVPPGVRWDPIRPPGMEVWCPCSHSACLLLHSRPMRTVPHRLLHNLLAGCSIAGQLDHEIGCMPCSQLRGANLSWLCLPPLTSMMRQSVVCEAQASKACCHWSYHRSGTGADIGPGILEQGFNPGDFQRPGGRGGTHPDLDQPGPGSTDWDSMY